MTQNAEASFYSIQQELQQTKQRLDALMNDVDSDEAKQHEQQARLVEANQQQKLRITQLESDLHNSTSEIDSLLENIHGLRTGSHSLCVLDS